MKKIISYQHWWALFTTFIAGASMPLSLSPFDYWSIAILSVAIFAYGINQQSTRKGCLLHAFIFGLGYYTAGIHWIYISINTFGSAPIPLAVLLMAIFIAFMALLFALPFYCLHLIKPQHRLLLGFPLIWFFNEWLRTWVLTGFPWLFIGYAHTDTILAGWAPIGGVLLVGIWSVFCSCALIHILRKEITLNTKGITIVAVAILWLSGYLLQHQSWTTVSEKTITVGMVQPNIPQDLRWAEPYQTIIPERLRLLSDNLWDNDWVIWPEGIIHNTYHRSLPFIEETEAIAKNKDSTVISGVLYDEYDDASLSTKYFNSVIVIDKNANSQNGHQQAIYHKRRLVPFGEYVPLEDWIRGLITFFDLPFSVISSGQREPALLQANGYRIGNAICYEIAYPTLVAEQARDADVLLTISNDAWFGDSIGPYQHLQIARMRAQETGRYIIRATNNGISAIINTHGQVIAESEQFTATTLTGTVYPTQGLTPFVQWQHYPTLIMCALLLFILRSPLKKSRRQI